MLRAVSLFLALLMAACMFVACADKGDDLEQDTTTQPPSNTESENPEDNYINGFIKDNLPENLGFGGNELTILYWSDYTMTEFFVEGMNGDIINDAIYGRNLAVEDRLDVSLSYFGEKAYNTNMTAYMQAADNDVNSGLCEYDIYAAFSKTIAAMALKGSLTNLMEVDHLDFSMPWWPDSLVDQCTINDSLYFCSGDISTNMLWMMIGTFFNIDLVESYGLEDPYGLVEKNEWTIDKLIEMTSNIYSDLNLDNRPNDGDMFGFIIYDENIDAFFTSAGLMSIDKDRDGELMISPSFHGETMINLIGKIGNYIAQNPGVHYSTSIYIRENLFNQNAVFTMDRVFIVAGKDNREYDTKIEFPFGIVPNAKNKPTDEYYTNLGHPFTMYAISHGMQEADLAGAVLECLASESYRQVTPIVFEKAMKIKYAFNEKSSQMYDIIRSTVVFDLGRLYASNFHDITSDIFRQQVLANSSTFASSFKSLEKTINAGIKVIMDSYSNY